MKTALAERWASVGLLPDSVLLRFAFGEAALAALASGSGQELAPISACRSPDNKIEALSFAVSLRETRRVDPESPLHDALYVERYSRLLPTWTVSPRVPDEAVLGTWLTGGVVVAATSFRRLASLMGRLGQEDVRTIVETAGFSVPGAGGLLTRARAMPRPKDDVETSENAERTRQKRPVDGRETPEEGGPFRLPGRPALEAFFNEHVIDLVVHAERYRALGIEFPSAIALHGPPGCGKTFAVERLVEFLDWPSFHVDSHSMGSPYIHETSRKIADVFEQAMDAAPSVMVIDEMEAFLSDRQIHASTGLHHVEEVAEFLRRIPQATAKRVLVIGMTNRLEMIDSAILRRGRFDHVIEVGMPSREEVTALVTALLQQVPTAGDIALDLAVTALTGRPLSDAAFAIREAARQAAKTGKTALDQESLRAGLASLPLMSPEHTGHPIGFVWR